MKVNRLRNYVGNFKDSVGKAKQWFWVQIFNLYCDCGTHSHIYYLRHDIKGF